MAAKIQPETKISAKVSKSVASRLGLKSQYVTGTFAQFAKLFGPMCHAGCIRLPFDCHNADGSMSSDYRIKINGVEHKLMYRVVVPGTEDVKVFFVALEVYWNLNFNQK